MHESIYHPHMAPNLSLLQDRECLCRSSLEGTPIQTHRTALSAPPSENMPSAQWLLNLSALQELKVLIPLQLGSPESKILMAREAI